MKLSLSEKFLWDVYNTIEKLGYLIPPLYYRWSDIFYPELKRIKEANKRKYDRQQFAELLAYLKRKDYLQIRQFKNMSGIIITPKGFKKLLKIKTKLNQFKKRKDGKWQMVIFDIPEKKRKQRDQLRNFLQLLGYEQLQKSIWVCPYDVLKETEQCIQENHLIHEVKLLLIEEIQ